MDSKKSYFNYVGGWIITSIDGEIYQRQSTKEEAELLFKRYLQYQNGEIGIEDVFEEKKIENKLIGDGWYFEEGKLFHEELNNPVDPLLKEFVKDLVSEEKDTRYLLNFCKLCEANSNKEAIEGLFRFIQHNKLTITPDGMVRGKKRVKMLSNEQIPEEYIEKRLYLTDYGVVLSASDELFSATVARDFKNWIENIDLVASWDGKTKYKIGEWTTVPRNKCVTDRNVSCGYSLHIGGDRYVQNFSGNVVVSCLFSPADVISIPYNEEADKIRVCALKTIGLDKTEPLGKTVIEYEEDYEDDDSDLIKEKLLYYIGEVEDDEHFDLTEFLAFYNFDIDCTLTALRELVKEGSIKIVHVKDKKGRFTGDTTYVLA